MAIDSTETRPALLEIRLDMHVPDFKKKQEEFLVDLARLLGVEASTIAVVSVRKGCTYLVISLPAAAAKALTDDYEGELTGDRSLDLKKLLREYPVKWIRAADEVQAAMIATAFADLPEGPAFTWLHLSDLHMRATEGSAKFNQEIILDGLQRDLPGLLDKQKLSPDVLFFTGDLAQSGEESEYNRVEQFLKSMVNSLRRPPAVYVVPGNHDVQWAKIDVDLERRLRASLSTEENVDDLLLEPKSSDDRNNVFKRLINFREFQAKLQYLGQPPLNHDYFYSHVSKHSGFSIGVAGLNSAWRCTRKDNADGIDVDLDLGHLLLGKPQLHQALKQIEDADIRFALVHHPPMTAWFSQADFESQKAYLPNFDFLLRGHEHLEHPIRIGNLHTAEDALHLAGGALYEGAKTPLSVGVGRMDFNSGVLWLYFLNFNYKHRRWLYDSDPYWPLGKINLELPLRVRKKLALSVKGNAWSIPALVNAFGEETRATRSTEETHV